MKDYLKKIENTYKKWEDVYEKDVNDPYIASDSWNPHCELGEKIFLDIILIFVGNVRK